MRRPRVTPVRLSHVLRTTLAAVLVMLGTGLSAGAAHAADYVSITGAGSTWSQIAVDAWRADIRSSGVVVNFAGTGSTDGRLQFIQGTVDFAGSEIPFQNPPEPGQQAEVSSREYAYLPIVAGGTAFMYNLTLGGKRIRDVRLSGTTLAKIFTGQITRWNDPAITKDYGRALPNVAIIPIVRSDGAGASFQFSLYMKNQFPSVYCPFIRQKLSLSGSDCPATSFYPQFGSSKAQVGSNGVANYISAQYGEGAIGYVEYAYAKRVNFPVVNLLNKAGYYTEPTAGNVAVSLTKAKINDNLTQNLESVYTNPDKRTYPMSSYSYMIIPTSTQKPFNTDKGRTLSTYINYFLCTGQQKADILGYSPLPKNLVLAGFDQVARIPGTVSPPSISTCNNPALRILQTAPMPPACSKAGNPPCGSIGTVAATGGGTAGSGRGAASGGSGAKAAGSGTGAASGTTGGTSGAGTPTAPAVVDPLTGVAAVGGTVAVDAAGVPVTVAASRQDEGQTKVLYAIAALALLVVVVAPPLAARFRPRRSGPAGQ